MYYHFATASIPAPGPAALLRQQLCLHFVRRAVVILPDGEVNKRPDAALETWECFDNVICAAPAGTRPVKIAAIDLTAVGSAQKALSRLDLENLEVLSFSRGRGASAAKATSALSDHKVDP